ncbi:MAG: hypothetical protein JWQ77_1181 [Jatrophihabitans sp.]|nr:hypothetical protein [Jatrophihabitans sp.]
MAGLSGLYLSLLAGTKHGRFGPLRAAYQYFGLAYREGMPS